MLWAAVAVEGVAIVVLAIAVIGIYSLLSSHQQQLATLSVTNERFATKLHLADRFPIGLGAELPPRLLVLFVSHGCSSCVQVSRNLFDVRPDWPLWIILSGSPSVIRQGSFDAEHVQSNGRFPIPPYARVFADPAKRWQRELGVTATPIGMAIINGRLVDQIVGPTARWFQELPHSRSRAGRAIASSVGASIG